MKDIVSKYENEKYIVNIYYDDSPETPREWDNLGTMICFHKRYRLGDDTEYSSSDFDSWDELKSQLIKDGAHIILPIYMYDHSGLTINTTGFSCPWDSGQIGYIYITKDKIKKEYSVKRMNKSLTDRITKYLISEVETYDDYLTGNVYGYVAIDKETGDEIDSGWGFYGDDFKSNGILDEYDGLVEIK